MQTLSYFALAQRHAYGQNTALYKGNEYMKTINLAAMIATASLLAACGSDDDSTSAPAINMEKAALVLETNADIAYATYTDSVITAQALKAALAAFKTNPTLENLTASKKAWLVSREPYGQSEVYRFRESPIEAVEGDINAWPLGEALIDYVATGNDGDDFDDSQIGVTAHSVGDDIPAVIDVTNAAGNNIIQTTTITIDENLLASTASADDEHDVIAGYHAIEFLLWGQDLNITNQSTTNGSDRELAVNSTDQGGQRPLSDFEYIDISDTTNEAVRRHLYLEVAVNKLIADLAQVQLGWKSGVVDNYRAQFVTINDASEAKQKLTEILTGMGTLSEGELAGERMQIAFASNSQEDEHSCFSDNTHRDIWLDAEGVSNSFYGQYTGYDSTLNGEDDVTTNAVNGYGINDYLKDVGLDSLATTASDALTATQTNYTAIDTLARDGSPFDVQIMEANRTEQSPVALTIKSLSTQANVIQNIADGLGLGDVVDDEASACNTQDPNSEC